MRSGALAKVVGIHWESHTVDLVFTKTGRSMRNVRVQSSSASTNTGLNDLPKPDIPNGDPFVKGGNTGTRDIIATVQYFDDLPIVTGFLHPVSSEMMFSDQERMVYRHASDVYHTIDKDGNFEVYHPSGAYVRFGASPSHEDLTGKDFDKKWKIKRNTGKKINIHIEQADGVASVNIDPGGNIDINNAGNTSVSTGGNLSATVGGTTTIESSGDIKMTAPTITLNGAVVVNGALTQGKGSNGGSCSMQGPLNVVGDVIADGISLTEHDHEKGVGKPT